LLRAWSFQAKLGIVTNTLLQAAPQLGHLLLVILACILVFACVACMGLGERVSYLNSAGAAVEETFSVLLGLGSVTLADVFPDSVSMSAAEALLGLFIYYLRVVLFVMILSQYFMVTLGAEFTRLKWLGRVLHARSIGADVAADIAPEVQLRMQHLARHIARCRTKAAVAPADAVQCPAGSLNSTNSTTNSREALQLIRGCMPHLDSSSNGEKTSGSQPVVEILGRQLDLPALQQLLLQLTVDSRDIHNQRSAAGSAATQPVDDSHVEAAPAPGATCAAAVAAAAAQLFGALQGLPSNDGVNEDLTHDEQEVRGLSKQVCAQL
jgi:hypothetical protein